MKNKKFLFLLFLFFFIANISVMNKIIWEFDGHSVLEVSKSIIEKHNFAINCSFGEKAKDGNCYSRYGILTSIVILPFILMNNLFKTDFFIFLVNPLITAGLGVLIFLFLKRLKFNDLHAVFGSFLLSFCTFSLAYSRTLFSEPLLIFLIFATFYRVFFKKNAALAGLFFGFAFLTKTTAVLMLPSIFLYFFLIHDAKKIIKFIFIFLFFLLLFFLYNFARFGNILNTGYPGVSFDMSILSGLSYFLFSTGGSIFLYQPFIVFFLFGFFYFKKDNFKVFLTLTVFALIFIIAHSIYSIPSGGWSWGPRLLYPILPVFVIITMYFWRENRNKLLKVVFIVFVFVSLLIQIISVLISYNRYLAFINKKYNGQTNSRIFYSPSYSPITSQLKMIFKISYEKKDEVFWNEAFQERKKFDIKNTIGPFDLYFLWSRKNELFLLIIFCIEGILFFKLKNWIFNNESKIS